MTSRSKIEPHYCRESHTCTCNPLAIEPSETCPVHGAGERPLRCWRCGRFLSRER